MNYEYRRALPGDKDELVDMRMKFLREVQQDEDLSIESEVRKVNDAYFSGGMAGGDVICFIAIHNGKIVGTSGLCFLNRPPSFKNPVGTIGYIMNMYTLPQYRCQGIASKLFKLAVEEAGKCGVKKITLHATEEGRRLYGDTKNYYCCTDGYLFIDVYYMHFCHRQ